MQARGALMKEHRLIERMLSAVRSVVAEFDSTRHIDHEFVEAAVDRRAMNELIADHAYGRQTTDNVARANKEYWDGDDAALTAIVDQLRTLCDFYPRHIEKEDKLFFPAARAYVTDEEDEAMLARFWEFDRAMIHEKYKLVVEALKQAVGLRLHPTGLGHARQRREAE